MQSQATTVDAYLESLPPDRREAIGAVRKTILANLDDAIEESMQYGMISYCVPHAVFPAGYHCDPRQALPYACLASQKNHMSLYLMSVYCGSEGAGVANAHARWFKEAWAKSGKKLDMGKSCIRFKKLEDVPLDVIGEAVRRVPAKKYIGYYQAGLEAGKQASKARAGAKQARPAKRAAKKAPKKAK